MMVVFVSRSKGKAMQTVRKILDSFALRIGTDVWRTVITAEGLRTVHTLLRRHATKSTAVSCHWIRSRSRSDLVWIVGNRSAFNADGVVPVHTTSKNIAHREWENDWQYLGVIKAAAALSALLHDWGKASDVFQHKLKAAGKDRYGADPLRHEWVSCKLLEAVIQYTEAWEDDRIWLSALIDGSIVPEKLIDLAVKNTEAIGRLPPVASLLTWIILSHHRLPVTKEGENEQEAPSFQSMLKQIHASWGYSRPAEKNLPKSCFSFKKGILWDTAAVWRKCLKKWAAKMLKEERTLRSLMEENSPAVRSIAMYARFCLMLSDHYISSLSSDEMASKGPKKKHQWSSVDLWANTAGGKQLKQRLEEHVVSVMEQALQIAHELPAFAEKMEAAEDIGFLKRKSPPSFQWQDKAVDAMKQFRKQQDSSMAYFVVNMASTGCGKTIANAKIVNSLSERGNSLRYVLALGLRTLTLQTGDEYRNRIGLDESELAVIIGSSAVRRLHETEGKMQLEDSSSFGKSESLLHEDIIYDDTFSADQTAFLNIFFSKQSEKYKAFLYKPVLVATIDYLMAATETIRGGRYMLPLLRLMSSDLVIDEIDDFSKKDLIAISRLVHLAGMLGRNVVISSATIPPDLAQGMFRAYTKGLSCYNECFAEPKRCGVMLCDEFKTKVAQIPIHDVQAYARMHAAFAEKRVTYLEKQRVKRKGIIVDIPEDDENHTKAYFNAMAQAAVSLHDAHHIIDAETGKKVSFGIIRLANISPCVACSLHLMSQNCSWPENYAVRVMTYHSRQILLMRHEQEAYLDAVLKRKYSDDEPVHIEDPVLRHHLDNVKEDNVLFIVVATPVEEIGRDHDFDWAVVEPSSYRSIIQLAGRVLRHRRRYADIADPNIAVMAYNLRGWRGEEHAFIRPGYEIGNHHLISHNMHDLIDETAFSQRIDAAQRIQKPETLYPERRLADLEHCIMEEFNDTDPGPQGITGWLDHYWWMTGMPQQYNPFRSTIPNRQLVGKYEDGCLIFYEWINDNLIPREGLNKIEQCDIVDLSDDRVWLQRDYGTALQRRAAIVPDRDEYEEGELMKKLSEEYGEITIPDGNTSKKWCYADQFGLFQQYE